MLVSLSDSSTFDINVSKMTDDLQVEHLSKRQSLSLQLQINFLAM